MLFRNRKTCNVLSVSDKTVIALMQKSDLYKEEKSEAPVKAEISAPNKKRVSKTKTADNQ